MNRARLLAAALAAIWLAGCTADMSPSPGLADPVPSPYHDPQVTVIHPEIREWVRFHPALISARDGQPMEVEIPARNTTDRLYIIQYRYVFYDREGRTLEPEMSWHRAALRPKTTVHLEGTSMTANAVRFKLEVKWANG